MARYGLHLNACNVGVHNSACVFWPGGIVLWGSEWSMCTTSTRQTKVPSSAHLQKVD